ncbi:MAG TPA: hypothetical protein VN442_20725 [Bryobacteraceae bacterium]|nr:hypothetical protein [Bryobacteraceae bacterium]
MKPQPPLDRLRAARVRVAKARTLMLRPSRKNLETCSRLVEVARDLLAGVAPGGTAERAEAAVLVRELAAATVLARQAGRFWGDCVRLGDTGARAYAPRGTQAACLPRPLGEA